MESARRPNYFLVFAFLVVSTLIETLVSYVRAESIKIPVLAVLAVVKVLLVLLYFMHLKYDSRVFSYLFIAGCVLVIPLILIVVVVMPLIV
jgi:cytochrome c oxidase subunit 4